MPPSSKASKPKPALRQSALSFPSKRSGSAADKDAKGKGKSKEVESQSDRRKSSTVPSTPAPRHPRDDESDEEEIAKRTYLVEDEDDATASVEGPPPVKRRRVAKGKGKETEDAEGESNEKGVFRSRASIENADGGKVQPAKPKAEELPHLDVEDKKGRWRKHYGEVREKMGNIPPGTPCPISWWEDHTDVRDASPCQGAHEDRPHSARL